MMMKILALIIIFIIKSVACQHGEMLSDEISCTQGKMIKLFLVDEIKTERCCAAPHKHGFYQVVTIVGCSKTLLCPVFNESMPDVDRI